MGSDRVDTMGTFGLLFEIDNLVGDHLEVVLHAQNLTIGLLAGNTKGFIQARGLLLDHHLGLGLVIDRELKWTSTMKYSNEYRFIGTDQKLFKV